MTSSLTTSRSRSHDTATPAIEAENLVKLFGRQRAVDGVSLSVPVGTVYGVLGPNGAGKTTTVRMLATLLRPDGGSARIFGHDVVRSPTAVRSLVGVTGQYASVDQDLTATENLMIFSRLLGLSTAAARRRSRDLLEEFALTDAADKALKNFSGGMRRRLDLAASLIATPPLLFLDEPTTGLDPRTRAQMWDTIRRLVADGTTVLLTTQYLDEADQLADRIAVIDRGRVVADGTADDLKRSVGTSTLRLVLVDRADVDRARTLIAASLRADVATTPEAGALTAPLTDPSVTPDLLVRLRDENIVVDEIAVQKPSLDEVFLSITGHDTDTDTERTSA
ncbi:daunorubicin resistance protein DrrA family ABC transporter ATP-binding protein [Rhodococcus rhodnii]|uniref:ABC transporter, ATP-binding protein n=2 Tax=Rhodococcus rhodnii TaxID=38312 RepID=R7WPB9_9NOCA|nr:daunorubicin resistance protein DrrA family ABC transporter ATP-binding protein [Rhodococcus rhodnii]EOM77167.1 ABC transporter, ATP-binding protein [Rhodococcus rhodnii LMG 5362]TXG91947.1 daunorubicin resistance protein DrrA family ABC transporter ATP-binding protein [Rhodococcus rhodnii]